MGFLTRLLVPRSVRRAVHPGRAVTPKVVKKARRAMHPAGNAKYSIERSIATSLIAPKTASSDRRGSQIPGRDTTMTWSGTRNVLLALVLAAVAGIVPAGTALARSIPATSAPAASLRCNASMTNSHPADYTSTGVKVGTVPYAGIKTVAHYKTTNHPKRGTASARGRRTIWYYISGATPGYRVVVDVYVWRHHRTGSCSTSFTPHR